MRLIWVIFRKHKGGATDMLGAYDSEVTAKDIASEYDNDAYVVWAQSVWLREQEAGAGEPV